MLHLIHEYQGQPLSWYALVSDAPGSREHLYQSVDGHPVEPLYLNTPLEALLAQSPLLVALNHASADPLVKQLPDERTLYFSAPAELPFDTVIEQLRWRLLVYFAGQRKGIFHYYQPEIASYFLSGSDEQSTSDWLGALCSVGFYCQTLSAQPGWVEIGDYTSTPDMTLWSLPPDQTLALDRLYEEREVQQWGNDTQTPDIHWPTQNAVTRFCDTYTIEAPTLRARLRQLAHRTQRAPAFAPMNEAQFTRLSPEDKVTQLEQIAVRESYYG